MPQLLWDKGILSLGGFMFYSSSQMPYRTGKSACNDAVTKSNPELSNRVGNIVLCRRYVPDRQRPPHSPLMNHLLNIKRRVQTHGVAPQKRPSARRNTAVI